MAQIIPINWWWAWWGGGAGDMLKSVYDPNNVEADAFDYDNFINTPTVNVQSFTLASTSDIANAQLAYNWYLAGNTPIVKYNNASYLIKSVDATKVILCSTWYHDEAENSYTWKTQDNLIFSLSDWTVTWITTGYGGNLSMYYLSPWVNYGTPYTPQYDWSPATKKYVDDNKTTVVDALNSTSSTSALSANQGKVLNDKIAALFWLWKFLSLWDATTWQPISFPLDTPYTYTTWDYFLVEIISSATPPVNYKPTGSSYTGTASSTAETEELEVWDIYIYDWTNWLLQLNHWKTVSFSEIAWQPTDNANLATALSAKANDDAVVKLTGDQTIAWTKTFSTSPVVPNKTADATNTWTAIATEAQVYKKQDKLTTQTAYTSKWTSTKVPTITTNTLWQVTGITETSIAFPVTSVNWQTWAVSLTIPTISTITVTLTSAWWSSNSQTVSATGVTASNTVIVSPSPDDIADYADCGVYCSAQGSGTLTFSCSDTPSSNIDVNVVILS